MIVEVIAVGTELLIGEIVNSNAAVIGRRLAEEGFDAHHQVVVGDNSSRLTATLEAALARSDAIVITGGIGPTQDDLTREAICVVADREMTRDEMHAAWIDKRIRSQRRAVPDSVLRMADLPEGAEGMANANGVALGVAMEHSGKWIFAMPGVPVEMTAMLDNEVMPRLRKIARRPAVLRNRLIHTWGLGESQVAHLLEDLYESSNPSIAFLIREMEVRVRISAKAADETSADELIAPIEAEVRSRLGGAVFATGDETVEGLIVAGLNAHGWTVGTVERATLGHVGSRIAALDGGDAVFAGTVIEGTHHLESPAADVILRVGEIGPDRSQSGRLTGPVSRRLTRSVTVSVDSPDGANERVFEFGGDDERVRSFATLAGLHLIRIAVQPDVAV